jgi:hypothetical protein
MVCLVLVINSPQEILFLTISDEEAVVIFTHFVKMKWDWPASLLTMSSFNSISKRRYLNSFYIVQNVLRYVSEYSGKTEALFHTGNLKITVTEYKYRREKRGSMAVTEYKPI